MSTHTFLFTYSVSPRNKDCENVANVIRDRIARLDGKYGFEKLDNVETAFKGEISLSSISLESKRKEAEKYITNILKVVFDANYPLTKVDVFVALLVDKLSEVIEFSF